MEAGFVGLVILAGGVYFGALLAELILRLL